MLEVVVDNPERTSMHYCMEAIKLSSADPTMGMFPIGASATRRSSRCSRSSASRCSSSVAHPAGRGAQHHFRHDDAGEGQGARTSASYAPWGRPKGAIMRVFLITGASIGVVGTHRRVRSSASLFTWNIEGIKSVRVMKVIEHGRCSIRAFLLSDADAGGHRSVRETAGMIVAMALLLSVLATHVPVVEAPRVSIRSKRCGTNDHGYQSPCRHAVSSTGQSTVLKLEGLEREIQARATREISCASRGRARNSDAGTGGGAGRAVRFAGKSTLLHVTRDLLETPDSRATSSSTAGIALVPVGRPSARAMRRRRNGLRLSVPSVAAGILGAGKRGDPADDPGATAAGCRSARAGRCSVRSGLAIAPNIARPNFPVANSSAPPSAGALRMRPGCCWLMSRRGISIRARPSTCFRSLFNSVREHGVAALIATHNMDLARRMDRVLQMQDGVSSRLLPRR